MQIFFGVYFIQWGFGPPLCPSNPIYSPLSTLPSLHPALLLTHPSCTLRSFHSTISRSSLPSTLSVLSSNLFLLNSPSSSSSLIPNLPSLRPSIHQIYPPPNHPPTPHSILFSLALPSLHLSLPTSCAHSTADILSPTVPSPCPRHIRSSKHT